MLVQKSIAREMLTQIENSVPEKESWAWRIMHSLPEIDNNHLFSEYETYGHYLKNRYPDRVRFVDRELFNGLLVPLQARDIDTNSKHGFEAMDQALKTRAEQN